MAKTAIYKTMMEAELKRRLDDALHARRATLTGYSERLAAWFVEQDPLLQSMLLGQIEKADHAKLAGIVLRRMKASGNHRKKK